MLTGTVVTMDGRYNDLSSFGGNGLFCKDFIPVGTKSGRFESFDSLIESVNEWIIDNNAWEVKTLETIELPHMWDGTVESQVMSYAKHRGGKSYFVRGIRLWAIPKDTTFDQSPQQVGYVTFTPQLLETGGMFKFDKYERIDTMLAYINNELKENPIPGKLNKNNHIPHQRFLFLAT